MTVRIRVDEGEDAPVTLQFKRRAAGGTTVPVNLASATEIELIVKNKLSDLDTNKKFSYTLTSGKVLVTVNGNNPGDLYSEITVNIVGTDQTPPANYYFKVVTTKSGKKETIAKGVWTIENT